MTLPLTEQLAQLHGIDRLLAVVEQLRHPKQGCPWDLKQTHQSLKRYLLEEAYETVEAIDALRSDEASASLCEELGDLLLQIALHAQIAKENQDFNFQDVAESIAEKLVHRHPHVFGDVTVADAEEVTRNWEAIKAEEKKHLTSPESILDGTNAALPALIRATEISKRAVKVGFKWPNDESLWECVMSEFEEFRHETRQPTPDASKLEDEMGDIFFAAVSLANHYKVDPETALVRANEKFSRRFRQMEILADKPLETLSYEEWDHLWKQAKKLSEA